MSNSRDIVRRAEGQERERGKSRKRDIGFDLQLRWACKCRVILRIGREMEVRRQ